MNCKPDELAMIVNAPDARMNVVGRIVHVRESITVSGEACWTYDHMPLRGAYQFGSWVWHELPDEFLRPIRDNDGQDETLSWKAVPKPDPVHLAVNDAERALRAFSNHPLRLVVGTAPTELGRPL